MASNLKEINDLVNSENKVGFLLDRYSKGDRDVDEVIKKDLAKQREAFM